MVPDVVVVGANYGDLAARRGYLDVQLAVDELGLGPIWVLERDGGALRNRTALGGYGHEVGRGTGAVGVGTLGGRPCQRTLLSWRWHSKHPYAHHRQRYAQ